MSASSVILRTLGLQDYEPCWHAMQEMTRLRDDKTPDEIWLLEHPPVYTQGQNGKPEHILAPSNIPIIKIDRGGQVTYHGPGQLVVYTMVDLRRKKLNVRDMVSALEQSVICLLQEYQLSASAKKDAPGVYVDNKKICSVGLRIRRGCSYHGLALNIAMDLTPFKKINPCGYAELEMTQLSELSSLANTHTASMKLIHHLSAHLGYTNKIDTTEPFTTTSGSLT